MELFKYIIFLINTDIYTFLKFSIFVKIIKLEQASKQVPTQTFYEKVICIIYK